MAPLPLFLGCRQLPLPGLVVLVLLPLMFVQLDTPHMRPHRAHNCRTRKSRPSRSPAPTRNVSGLSASTNERTRRVVGAGAIRSEMAGMGGGFISALGIIGGNGGNGGGGGGCAGRESNTSGGTLTASDEEGLGVLRQQLSAVQRIRIEHERKDAAITALRLEVRQSAPPALLRSAEVCAVVLSLLLPCSGAYSTRCLGRPSLTSVCVVISYVCTNCVSARFTLLPQLELSCRRAAPQV